MATKVVKTVQEKLAAMSTKALKARLARVDTLAAYYSDSKECAETVELLVSELYRRGEN